MAGLVLLVQNATDRFDTWAYAWALMLLAGAGTGRWLVGVTRGRRDLVASGGWMIAAGWAASWVLAVPFEAVIGIGGRGQGRAGHYALAVLLILAGRSCCGSSGGEFPALDPVLATAAELVEAEVRGDAEALWGRFTQERGPRPRRAPRRGRRRHPGRPDQEPGPGPADRRRPRRRARRLVRRHPQQVATDRAAVEAMGESMPVQGRLPDVAVRAALGTSAPSTSSTRPPGVLGALLRFPTA
jgi:hypothetical protein